MESLLNLLNISEEVYSKVCECESIEDEWQLIEDEKVLVITNTDENLRAKIFAEYLFQLVE